MSIQPPTRSPRCDATPVFRIRFALVRAEVALPALVFVVSRQAPPAPSLEQPGEAFVDRVGLVSGDYARETAAARFATGDFEGGIDAFLHGVTGSSRALGLVDP